MIEDKKIGLKVATKEEAYWIEVKKNMEIQIADLEKNMKFQKAILEMANDKIALEQAKK